MLRKKHVCRTSRGMNPKQKNTYVIVAYINVMYNAHSRPALYLCRFLVPVLCSLRCGRIPSDSANDAEEDTS